MKKDVYELGIPYIIPPPFEKWQERDTWSKVMKRNISLFYEFLFAGVYGGVVQRVYKTETERIGTERRNSHPDIVLDGCFQTIITEVKATSFRSSKYYCGERQLENMVHAMLKGLSRNRTKTHDFQYAFFVYGNHADYLNGFVDKKQPPLVNLIDLNRVLAEKTKLLVVLPSNLLLYLLMQAERTVFNQVSSGSTLDYAKTWLVRAREVTSFGNGNLELDSNRLLPTSTEKVREFLCLDELVREESTVTPELSSLRVPIAPFRAVRYRNPGNRWIASFKKNHAMFLESWLAVRDLHAEKKRRKEELEGRDLPF
jgi:hypothetical protein